MNVNNTELLKRWLHTFVKWDNSIANVDIYPRGVAFQKNKYEGD